jgi:hypothetical protein
VAVIRGEISPEELERDLAATCDAVEIMAAAYESARTGRWIGLAHSG